MIKKSKNNSKKKAKNSKKNLSDERPNLIINISGLKCHVEINDEIYSEKDKKDIEKIIKHMSKDIWIDKTYVSYKGSRWKNSLFTNEELWYDFCKMVIKTDLGKRGTKKDKELIVNSLVMIGISYLYLSVANFGYDTENINICPKESTKFKSMYEMDDRTSWNF